jgi:hypothetical protein
MSDINVNNLIAQTYVGTHYKSSDGTTWHATPKLGEDGYLPVAEGGEYKTPPALVTPALTIRKCKIRLEDKVWKDVYANGRLIRQVLVDAKIYVEGNEQTVKCRAATRLHVVRFFAALIEKNGNFVAAGKIDSEYPQYPYSRLKDKMLNLARYVVWGSNKGYALADLAFQSPR